MPLTARAKGATASNYHLTLHWLSNRVITSYDNIVDHSCEAWNKLVDQPWRIMTIGLRNWACGS